MGAAGPAIGIQALGGAVGAYGAYQQGLAQSNYYKYQAANARTESDLVQRQADQESGFAQSEGLEQKKRLDRTVAGVEGAQTAAAGANVGGGSVTSQDIARDTFDKSRLDTLAIRYNADVKSWHAQNQAAMQKYALGRQAAEDEMAASQAKKAGKLGAINSLLGSSGQVANTWYSASRYGKS